MALLARSSRKRCREAATRMIGAILLASALRESYSALRFARAMQARTPTRRPGIRQDRSHSLHSRKDRYEEGIGTMSTGGCPIVPCLVAEMAARTECVDGDAASRVCRQALGRPDWPTTGSRNQIRHVYRICRLSLSRGAWAADARRAPARAPRQTRPPCRWATRQGQKPRWSSAIHLGARSAQFAHGAGLPYSPIGN